MRCKVFIFVLLGVVFDLEADAITMATWVDTVFSISPYYAIYNGTGWGTPAPITTDHAGYYDVSSACNPSTSTVVATWVDSETLSPYYAVYNGGTWSVAQPITSDPSLQGYYDVNVTFNAVNQEFIAVWSLYSDNSPYYSFYNGSTWTTPALIATPAQTVGVVFAAVNTFNGDIFAGWVDGISNYVKVAIYHNGSWGEPMQVGGGLNYALDDAYLVYDPYRNVMMTTWGGAYISARYPYYSIFDGTSWSTPTPIHTTVTVSDDVYACFDSTSNTIIATWASSLSPWHPYYSIFDGTEWSVPVSFEGSSLNVSFDVSVAYNPTLQKAVSTWSNRPSPNDQSYFSVYDETGWSTAVPISMVNKPHGLTLVTFNPSRPFINPPSNLTGLRQKNNFGLAYEWYNTISWTASSSSFVVGYHVYQNDILIASVGAETLSYAQHNQPQQQITTYSVTAFDEYNNESQPVSLTLSNL